MEVEDAPLLSPTAGFSPIHEAMDQQKHGFLLLGHHKIVTADQMGHVFLYDGDLHAFRTMSRMANPPKRGAISVPIENDLYVLDTAPLVPGLVLRGPRLRPDRDRLLRVQRLVMPPSPFVYTDGFDPSHIGPYSCTVIGGDKSVWVSAEGVGAYSYDAAHAAWSKEVDWALPFGGLAMHVLSARDDDGLLCASNLTAASAHTPPVPCAVWKDLVPPVEWVPSTPPYLTHLGDSKYCIARFFEMIMHELPCNDDMPRNEG